MLILAMSWHFMHTLLVCCTEELWEFVFQVGKFTQSIFMRTFPPTGSTKPEVENIISTSLSSVHLPLSPSLCLSHLSL